MKVAARVVPNVPSFSVDQGFWYSIPGHLVDEIEIGSIVRVPLSGRKVRGWVVEIGESGSPRLKDIIARSGSMAVFDSDQLSSLRWASHYYVAPLSAFLTRATPPNLPKSSPDRADVTVVGTEHPLNDLVERTVDGRRSPVTAVVLNWRTLDWIAALGPVLEAGRSVLLVAATAAEVERVASAARRVYGDAVAMVDGEDDAADTRAWEAAQSPSRLLIGTPKVASWHVADLGLGLVIEENRRAMKDRQTPTVHVRELMITRCRVEGFNLAFIGPTPGVELLARGAELVRPGNRAWPLVEVVDRREDQMGYLARRTLSAIGATAEAGKRVFVFTHRRVGFASTRCTRCRALRVCGNCGSGLGRVPTCPRCDQATDSCLQCGNDEFEEMGTVPERLVVEINRKAHSDISGIYPSDKLVNVGTERDLADLDQVALAVAADVDGMLIGSGYRTSEEALRQLVRLATVLHVRSGSRLMLQTTQPDSPLVTTMRRGDPIPYLESLLIERGREGMPPSSEMIALEVRGETSPDTTFEIEAPNVTILGPLDIDGARRWLLTGKLDKVRSEIRAIVGRWRDAGLTVRVDVDPIDV